MAPYRAGIMTASKSCSPPGNPMIEFILLHLKWKMSSKYLKPKPKDQNQTKWVIFKFPLQQTMTGNLAAPIAFLVSQGNRASGEVKTWEELTVTQPSVHVRRLKYTKHIHVFLFNILSETSPCDTHRWCTCAMCIIYEPFVCSSRLKNHHKMVPIWHTLGAIYFLFFKNIFHSYWCSLWFYLPKLLNIRITLIVHRHSQSIPVLPGEWGHPECILRTGTYWNLMGLGRSRGIYHSLYQLYIGYCT